MAEFEILAQSWFKRRHMDIPSKHLLEFEVLDFIKQDKHRCQMFVAYDNGDKLTLDARVYVNTVHEILDDGSIKTVETSWGVQALSPLGDNIVLRLKDA